MGAVTASDFDADLVEVLDDHGTRGGIYDAHDTPPVIVIGMEAVWVAVGAIAGTVSGIVGVLMWLRPRSPREEPWRLEHDRGMQYRLTNRSGRDAVNVVFDSNADASVFRWTGPWASVRAGASVEFVAIRDLPGYEIEWIGVTWSPDRHFARRRAWRASLP